MASNAAAINWLLMLIVVLACSAAATTLAEPRWAFRLSAWLHTWAECTMERRKRYAECLAQVREMEAQ